MFKGLSVQRVKIRVVFKGLREVREVFKGLGVQRVKGRVVFKRLK